MPKVSFYLAHPNTSKESAIYARICYSGKKLKYYPKEKIHPNNWNKKTQRAKETAKFPQHPEFNRRLNDFISQVDTVFSKYRTDFGSIPEIKTLEGLLDSIYKEIEPVKIEKIPFFQFYQEFVDKSIGGLRINYSHRDKKPIKYGTAKGFKTSLARLIEFQKVYKRKIDFDTIDQDFYDDYLKYLTKEGYSINYQGDHIKRLKVVLNDATDRGINSNLFFKSKRFFKLYEETEEIYLTDSELKDLEKLDLSKNETNDIVRDRFLLMCYTGLRISDVDQLDPKELKEGIFHIKQTKTGDMVAIPIHPVVKRIFLKYNNELPRKISDQKSNEYIKKIAEQVTSLKSLIPIQSVVLGKKVVKNVPKYSLITNHTGRRSFATNEYLKGTPAVAIMGITGHKTQREFMKYLKMSDTDNAKIIEKIWLERDNMKAV